MGIKRWMYKTIKGMYNKMLFQNILCTFWGIKQRSIWYSYSKTKTENSNWRQSRRSKQVYQKDIIDNMES